LYINYLTRTLKYNKTPKTSIQLKKRGFNLNSFVQDTKNPRFPTQLHIFFQNGTVRNVLHPVSREQPWKDISGSLVGRTGKILWAWGIQKGPKVHLLPQGQTGPDVPEALRLLFGQASYRAAQREPGLAVFLRHLSWCRSAEQF